MKKHLMAAGLAAGLLSPLAQADTILGIYAGVDGWQSQSTGSVSQNGPLETFNFDDETLTSFYVALEHPVPLVPNIKIKHNELEIQGVTNNAFNFGDSLFQVDTATHTLADLTHNDFVLYYEIFDNSLISIDLGFNVKQFDGSVTMTGSVQGIENEVTENVDFSGFVPLGYAAAQAGLPFTGLSVFFEGSLLAIDDSKIQDYQVGIAYEVIDNLAVDVAVKLGYRSMVLELDDIDDVSTDLEIKGPFAGVQVHF